MLAALPLERGERGTLASVKVIRDLIRQGRISPAVRGTAEQLLSGYGIAERDQFAEAETLFDFVRDRLRFTRDPVNVEQVTTAEGLLFDTRCGDCDDHVILLGSLLESVGIPVRLKIVRKHSSGPWKHIYLEAWISNRWLPLEPTNKKQPIGWEVPHGDSFVVAIDGDDDDLGILPAVLGIVSTVGSIYQQKKAQKAAEEQMEEQEKLLEKQAKAAKEIAQTQAETERARAETLKKYLIPAGIGLALLFLLRR